MSKVWFITGATRGIGAALVRAALGAGERVVATGRHPERVSQELGTMERFLSVCLDVTHESQAEAAVHAAFERFGRIDVVVNNAGFAILGSRRGSQRCRGAQTVRDERIRPSQCDKGRVACAARPGSRTHHQSLIDRRRQR